MLDSCTLCNGPAPNFSMTDQQSDKGAFILVNEIRCGSRRFLIRFNFLKFHPLLKGSSSLRCFSFPNI